MVQLYFIAEILFWTYDVDITKISNILNQNNDFLKWHEFALKFNLNVPFTTYCTMA